MSSLCQETGCLTHNIHIRILLHQQSIEDIQCAGYLLTVDLCGSSDRSETDQLVQNVMQSGRDQQTLQESVNKCAKCSRRCKKMTETIDDYVKYRPYKEHKQA